MQKMGGGSKRGKWCGGPVWWRAGELIGNDVCTWLILAWPYSIKMLQLRVQ